MATNKSRCLIGKNAFSRWVLINMDQPHLAWSGSTWVPHKHGVPTGNAQVCNFDDEYEALIYALEQNFTAALHRSCAVSFEDL